MHTIWKHIKYAYSDVYNWEHLKIEDVMKFSPKPLDHDVFKSILDEDKRDYVASGKDVMPWLKKQVENLEEP